MTAADNSRSFMKTSSKRNKEIIEDKFRICKELVIKPEPIDLTAKRELRLKPLDSELNL